jgi:acyl-[acyl-carrier-protein] desaturase
MAEVSYFDSPEIQKKIYRLYRDFFDMAEKRRRWNVSLDIPWQQCNPALNPAIADVVESFCTVELFLPDYIGKIMPHIRAIRGRAWFTFNWGYEESKHSLALGDWLLKSGQRSEEYMQDREVVIFKQEWMLPHGDVRTNVCYSMTQELATWLNYRNLRLLLGKEDPALSKVLGFIAVDERAHYDFFKRLVQFHLEEDRPGTLEALRTVLNNFAMPALYLLADGRARAERVRALRLFDDDIFYQDVYLPILRDLGIDRQELRKKRPRESVQVGAVPAR